MGDEDKQPDNADGDKKEDKGDKMKKGDPENDCSNGPIDKRGCTDPLCCLGFVAHWVGFAVVASMAFAEGNPKRLVVPRDFQGNYCGTEDNWGTNVNLPDHEKLFLSMNVSVVVDSLAKSLVCGGTVKTFLTTGQGGQEPLMTDEDFESACGGGSVPMDPDAIKAQAEKYSDPSQAAKLMSGSGGSILSEISKYFNPVCVPLCDVRTGLDARAYVYEPSGAESWSPAWNKLMSALDKMPPGLADAITKFQFTALSEKECPYDAKFCVPFPGINFEDNANYCTPVMNAAVREQMGAAISALDGIAASEATESVTTNFGTMIGDLETSMDVFVIVCFISLIVGFTFLVILRYTVGIVVWSAILMVFLLFVAGGIIAVLKSSQCKDESMQDSASSARSSLEAAAKEAAANSSNVNATTVTSFELPECLGGYEVESEDQREMLKYTGYVLFGLAALWALVICIMRNRIRLAIAINRVAADFVGDEKTMILVPVIQVLISVMWLAIWIYVAIFVVSQVPDTYIEERGPFDYTTAVGTEDVPGKCNNKWPTGFAWKDETDPLCNPEDQKCFYCAAPRYVFDVRFAYIFFSLLWNNAFVIASGQIIVAGACAGWYFTENQKKGSKPVIRKSVRNAFRYHPGSLAFGAFILAVVQFLKYWMYYLQKQAEANKNKVLEKVFKILKYVIACFEKCVKFLNKNAYIQIAILGKNFCKSAFNAFMLILRNGGRIASLGAIGAVVHFIGTFFIMVATAFIGYQLLLVLHPDDISSTVLPTMLYIIVGYVTAKLLMNVFGLAVDTILQCFVANEEMGGAGDFTHPNLRNFMKAQS